MNKPVNVECDHCKMMIALDKQGVSKTRVKMPDGERLSMTYFTCPHCRKSYRVALSSATTIQLENLMYKHNRAWAILRKDDDRKRFMDAQQTFQAAMRELQEKYKGVAHQWADNTLDMYVPGQIPEKEETT